MVDRTASVSLVADVSNYVSNMSRASNSTAGLGKQAQTTGELTRGVVSKIGGSLEGLGNQVGGTVGQILSTVGSDIDKLSSKAKNLGTTLEVTGGLALAAGLGLQELGSGEKKATDQLNASIKAAGELPEAYGSAIDKVVAKNENLGISSEDTKNALAKLIPAAGSTKDALKQMQLVSDLAAKSHISLASAATQVATILGGGSGRVLKQYGIQLQTLPNQVTATATAEKGLEKAQESLAASQTKLAQLTEIDRQRGTLTVAQKIQLKNAQDAVTKATGGVTDAQTKLSAAQNINVQKTKNADTALGQLAQKLNGQASASVNNFGGQVGVLTTKTEDFVKEVAGPVGQVLTGIGPILTVAGVAVDIYRARQEVLAARAAAAATALTDEGAAAESTVVPLGDAAVATTALDGAMDFNPIVAVGSALAVLAGVVGGALLIGGTKEAKKVTDDYTSSLDQNSGAITKNTKLQLIDTLTKDGTIKKAQELGISGDILIGKILGQKKATEEYDAAVKGIQATIDKNSGAGFTDTLGLKDYNLLKAMTGAVGDQSAAVKEDTANIKEQASILDGLATKADIAKQRFDDLTSAIKKEGKANPYGEAYSGSGLVGLPAPPKVGKGHANGGIIGGVASSRDNILTPMATGEGVATAAAMSISSNRSILAAMNAGKSVASTMAAPVYLSAPGSSGGDTYIMQITVPVSAGLVSDKAALAKEITDVIQVGVKAGRVSQNWTKQ